LKRALRSAYAGEAHLLAPAGDHEAPEVAHLRTFLATRRRGLTPRGPRD
jgi:hypothetical protein